MLSRAHDGLISRWWWTIDRWVLGAIVFLIILGIILAFASSPAIASKVNLEQYHFVKRQISFATLSILIVFFCSLLSPVGVQRLSYAVLVFALVGLLATILIGQEIKGATRWLYFAGLSVQPSEFVKPALMVVFADLMSREKVFFERFDGTFVSFCLLMFVLALLVLQPDIGQSTLIAASWLAVLFLSGIRLIWALFLMPLGAIAFLVAYYVLPHVQNRVDAFLEPGRSENFQVNRALEAAVHGGLFGVGPGEGLIKRNLPDAHTDFVFAVALEEYGLIACTLIIGAFVLVILRVINRVRQDPLVFVQLSAGGLAAILGIQAFLNMAVSLGMVPTTGMTLPFISYGGTSMMAVSLSAGFLLALTRARRGTNRGSVL